MDALFTFIDNNMLFLADTRTKLQLEILKTNLSIQISQMGNQDLKKANKIDQGTQCEQSVDFQLQEGGRKSVRKIAGRKSVRIVEPHQQQSSEQIKHSEQLAEDSLDSDSDSVTPFGYESQEDQQPLEGSTPAFKRNAASKMMITRSQRKSGPKTRKRTAKEA